MYHFGSGVNDGMILNNFPESALYPQPAGGESRGRATNLQVMQH